MLDVVLAAAASWLTVSHLQRSEDRRVLIAGVPTPAFLWPAITATITTVS